MGKALIIGCGGVASVTIHKCCQNSDVFEEICIASRTKSKCDALKEKLSGGKTKITTAQVDADDVNQLINLINEFKLTELRQVPIGVLKLFPGIQFELFEQIVSEKLSGVVLETFGEGNIPSNNRTLVSSIRRASENGAIVSVCSQCYRGTTKLGTYATSNALKESGAVGCNDMTTEAAVTKLYYLFSCGYPKETIKKLMTTNLRGEISV